MADFNTYAICERRSDGTKAVLATISCDDPKRAFFMSLFAVKQQYQKAGLTQPMFDADPRYFAEAVGQPIPEGTDNGNREIS